MLNWKKRAAGKRVIFFTGAGFSKPSGLSTYHDASGIWSKYAISEVCNYSTWKRNREKVFEFFKQAQALAQQATPSAGHHLVASLQASFPVGSVLHLTQNVDCLQDAALRAAGVAELIDDVYIKLHGSLENLQCTACGTLWAAAYDVSARCPKCSSLKGVKPGVVFYNESAPHYRKIHQLSDTLDSSKDLVIFIGTEFEIWDPSSLLPKGFSAQSVVNVNPLLKENPRIGTQLTMGIEEAVSHLEVLCKAWLA